MDCLTLSSILKQSRCEIVKKMEAVLSRSTTSGSGAYRETD